MEPASHRPRFRQDLIAESIDDTGDSGARFIDVLDPDSGHVFRFYEVEYSLACAMDGERDVPGIVQWAKDELGLSASAREVQSVISTLRDLGYLEPGAVLSPAARVAEPAARAESRAKPTAPPETVRPVEQVRAAESAKPPKPVDVVQPSMAAAAERAAAIPDLELGHVGPAASYTDTSMSPAADIELGSGITTAPRAREVEAPVEEIALGQSGRVDMGDLSKQVGVSIADVKEAVRASQIMTAADPESAAIELAESRPSERPVRHPTMPQPMPRATRTSDGPKQSDGRPEARSSDSPSQPAPLPEVRPAAAASERAGQAFRETGPARAVAAPVQPASRDSWRAKPDFPEQRSDRPAQRAESPAAEPPPPSQPDSWRASRQVPAIQRPASRADVLDSGDKVASRPVDVAPEPRASRSALGLLALLLVIAVAYVTYKVLLKKPEEQRAIKAAVPAPVVVKPPEPPPVEVEKLTNSDETTESIKPPVAVAIEKVQDGAVRRGDVMVRFVGHRRLDAEIAALEREIEKRVQPELAAALRDRQVAQTAGIPAKVAEAEKRLTDRQKSLNDKQARLALKRTELQKFQLRAPADGRVIAQVAPGTKATPADEIAKLIRSPMRIVTFKIAEGEPKSRVILVSKASGRKLPCTVVKVDTNGTTIECPLDVAPANTEVTFGGIDTSPPEGADAQPGSSAASSAPAASASGSATATGGAGAASTGGSAAATSGGSSGATNTNTRPATVPAQSPTAGSSMPAGSSTPAPAGSGEAPAKADKPAEAPADPPPSSGSGQQP